MATAGEGTAAGYEGGGAGGKFRKRPLRKNQTTPYDRPPTALRNPSWITKLVVDPASKLITSGAQRFFSSVFTKRLGTPPTTPTPLPPHPGPSQVLKDLSQDSRPNDYSGALVVAGQEGSNAACSSGDGTFSELEQLLKQKTFTRAEIDRLTELLRSKAVDIPIGNEEKRSEASQSRPTLDFSCSLPEENTSAKVTYGGVVATPVTSSRIVEDDIASPAELAKAYMGSRPSKVSPSMLSMRSQVVREDTPLLKNVQYVHKSPFPSLTPRNAGLLSARENGFTTPRSRGRSAIYSMARTPYSRVRQTDVQKASSSNDYVYGGASSSQSVLEHDGRFGSKQALKRRSYVLDDDIGPVGPMRRIRQKPNLLSRGVSRPSLGVASYANLHRQVSEVAADDQDNRTTPKRHVAVPPKSSETAAKILEHLEKLTPKSKSSESKLAAGKERTPVKLTPNMLNGRALRSLEDVDSPMLLQNAQDNYKLENWSKVFPPNPHESKQSEIEQNGHKSSVNESTIIAKDTIFSFKNAQSGVETNFLDNNSAAQPPQKKRAFKMSAHEGSFELEEDINSNGPSCHLAKGTGKPEISDAEQKSVSAAESMSKPAEARAPLGVSDKKTASETPDIGAITVKNTTFLASASSGPLNVNQPAPVSNKSIESVDKSPSFLFSSSTPFTATKPESSSSLFNRASSPTEGRPKPFESDNLPKAVDSNGKVEAFLSGPSTISASGIFSFGASSSTSSLSNGLFAPSPAISASSTLATSNFSKDVSTSSSSAVAPLTSIASPIGTTTGSSTAPINSLFGSGASSTVSGEPPFKFGSSGVPPPTVSAQSTTSTVDLKAKAEIGTTFGNLKSSSSAGGKSLFSAETSVAGSGISPISTSMPAQFGSSGSSPSLGNFPVFGSAPQVSASNSNLIGSSYAASGLFGFGASSSASSAISSTSAVASNGTTMVPFTFGASSAAPASETSAPASSNGASPGIFSFLGNSSASSTNAVNVSTTTTTTPGIFNFGSNSSSSSANAVNTSATPGIFSFTGSSSTSPTNAVNTPTSATPGIFGFGASPSASLTNASSTVSSSPFNFGASSTSSQTSSPAGIFGSSFQPSKSPGFSSPFSSSTPSGFTFGASSSSFATPSTSPVVFGSTPSASTGSAFLFGSTNSSSQTTFGNPTAFTAPPGNNDNMEDSMAEDPVQASSAVSFGQPSVSPSPISFGQPSVLPSPGGFAFGSTPPSPFQFGGQQSQATPQNPSPFAASGSLDFSAGGSFSLGSAGPDKSGRKIVKVSRSKNRRKCKD